MLALCLVFAVKIKMTKNQFRITARELIANWQTLAILSGYLIFYKCG